MPLPVQHRSFDVTIVSIHCITYKYVAAMYISIVDTHGMPVLLLLYTVCILTIALLNTPVSSQLILCLYNEIVAVLMITQGNNGRSFTPTSGPIEHR